MEVTRDGITLIASVKECNPREETECMGNMICFHRRYNLGDKHQFKTPEEFWNWYQENEDLMAVVLPLYLYDHSGLAMSTSDFGDKWDSGRVGYYYASLQDVKDFGYSEKDIPLIEARLEDEVKDYNSYLHGDFIKIDFKVLDGSFELNSGTVYGSKDDLEILTFDMGLDSYPKLKREIVEMVKDCQSECY